MRERIRELRAGSGRRLLVVDDNPQVRLLIASMLERIGFDTDSAEDSEAAVHLVRERRFDAVVSDVLMPGGADGLFLTARLRRVDPTLPVILYSGEAGEEMLTEAFRMGATDFLPKPVTIGELEHAVRRALALRSDETHQDEVTRIRNALDATRWNRKEAARRLAMGYRTLLRRMKELDIR